MPISEQYISDIRQRLRVSHNLLDTEIVDIIQAAKDDLRISGILQNKIDDEDDSLIKRAVVFFAKADFGLDNTDSEKHMKCYETLKIHLMLSAEYRQGEENVL